MQPCDQHIPDDKTHSSLNKSPSERKSFITGAMQIHFYRRPCEKQLLSE